LFQSSVDKYHAPALHLLPPFQSVLRFTLSVSFVIHPSDRLNQLLLFHRQQLIESLYSIAHNCPPYSNLESIRSIMPLLSSYLRLANPLTSEEQRAMITQGRCDSMF